MSNTVAVFPPLQDRKTCWIVSVRHSNRTLLLVSALLFAASAAVTILWCGSMSSMGEMPMPGGWSMSMAWMRMPGQTWLSAGASFVGMWVVMMVAMMMPCLVPMLSCYHRAVCTARETRPGRLTALVGVGYFFVWAMLGVALFPVGVALATFEMRCASLSQAVPMAAGLVVLVAGALQFTPWKTHQLACWRHEHQVGHESPQTAASAWQHGMRLGLHCSYCCAGFTAVLLVMGVMDLRVMTAVTAAITVERLAPGAERVCRSLGAVIVGAGLLLIARAAGRV